MRLREELQAREYIRQVLRIADRLDPASKESWESEQVPISLKNSFDMPAEQVGINALQHISGCLAAIFDRQTVEVSFVLPNGTLENVNGSSR